MQRHFSFALAILLCGPIACGATNPTTDAGPTVFDAGRDCTEPPDAGEFVALVSYLQDYRSWESFELPDGETGLGVRHVYLNKRPPHGSCAFPVGTIFVKDSPPIGIKGVEQIDAMVKRGGGFNDGGALGWEWMGLTVPVGDGGTRIAWRGTAPPPSAGYGPTNGACNGCHGEGADNDFVRMPPDDAGAHIAAPFLLQND